jgi:hypothetical protein
MEFIQTSFGGKIHQSKPGIWALNYYSQNAYAVLQQIYPYLVAQKEIVKLCMEFHEGYWRGIGQYETSPERQAIGAKYSNLLRLYHLKWRNRLGKRVKPKFKYFT